MEQILAVEVVILGDVTYGACCVDDFTSNLDSMSCTWRTVTIAAATTTWNF